MKWYLLAFKNYATFSGRARRKEYWMFVLFQTLVMLFFALIIGTTATFLSEIFISIISFIFIGYLLASFVPSISLAVRRMHDLNKSGAAVLIYFIPIIGGIWFLVLTCTEGTKGKNKYGLDPKNPIDELNDIGIAIDE